MNGLGEAWHGIKHFNPEDKNDLWGDPHKIQRELLVELDKLRSYLNTPVYVTSGYREKRGESEGQSQHHFGLAADIVVPDYNGALLDLFFAAMRFNFMGVGIYRDWERNGKKLGGLHVDMRKADHRAIWFCYKNRFGVQEYVALTLETLKGFGVV